VAGSDPQLLMPVTGSVTHEALSAQKSPLAQGCPRGIGATQVAVAALDDQRHESPFSQWASLQLAPAGTRSTQAPMQQASVPQEAFAQLPETHSSSLRQAAPRGTVPFATASQASEAVLKAATASDVLQGRCR